MKLHVNPHSKPLFYKARTVPFALREKLEQQLERLEKQDITPSDLFRLGYTNCAGGETYGSMRVCGDYKLTVNKVAKTEVYPLPKIKEMFVLLAGGKKFYLSHAYQQIEMEEESQKYLTVNTKGSSNISGFLLVLHQHLLFQWTMESLLQGLPSVCVYINDILVSGRDNEEHLCNLGEVLRRLKEAGIKLKHAKCFFFFLLSKYFRPKIPV